MPTVIVRRSVEGEEVASALRERLGQGYEVTSHGHGTNDALRVRQSAASSATVHWQHDGASTRFEVHGSGLVISRLINEFGIARRVSSAIEEAFGTSPTPGDRSN